MGRGRARGDGRPASTAAGAGPPQDAGGAASGDPLPEREDLFRILADSIPQLAWMTDASGWIYWYNRRWYEYTGTTLEEMAGWGWMKVHHPEHVERVVERFQAAIQEGEGWEDTFPLRSATGEYRWFLSRAQPIRDSAGQVVRWFGTNTDITEQREAAEARERILVAERAARERAERANAAKAQFLSVMSHELRTPLNAVIGYTDLLLAEVKGSVTDGQRQQLGRIDAAARHQLELIEEILAYARLDAGKEQVEPATVDVARLAADVAEIVRPQAEAKGLELRCRLPAGELEMVSDARKLRQVLLNLLGNAVKFTEAGAVELVVARDDEGAGIRLAVNDTGPGIPVERREEIFEPFTQVDQGATRQKEGAGLGLAITLRLVTLLGGTIHVEAPDGPGTVFCVRLPALHAGGG